MDLLRPNLLGSVSGGLDAERTRQFLDCVFRVLGHDLPNHLIALQGLTRLLAGAEEERLSSEGKEYVGRIAAVAERAQALAVSLSSTGRLLLQPLATEVVDVGEAVAEALAVVKAMCPELSVDYELPHTPVLVTVPRLSLDHVLACLLRPALSVASEHGMIQVALALSGENVEVSIRGLSLGSNADTTRDLLLIRLLVEAWGGSLRLPVEPMGRPTVVVTCPR